MDGQTVELPGVHVAPDGEIRGLTVDLFRRNLQANYLGDRRAWQREREQLRTEIQARSPENHPDVVRARLFSDEILRILDLDLDARDEALDKLKRELPLYQERARAEAAERRARTYETRQEQETRQAAFAATVPVLKEGLSDYLERALKHEKLADAGLDRAEIEEALLRQFGPRGLFDIGSEEAKRAPDLDTPIGPVRLQTQVIDGYLLSMAAIARRGRDRIEAAERRAAEALAAAEAAKKNAQALAPETSAPPIVPASGAPTGSDTARPWRDPSKSPEERQKLFADYMARQGVPI